MRRKSWDVPTKSVTSLFYVIPSHHTSEHGPMSCSPWPNWRCRPWNCRGRASNRQWDTELEQPRQQKWNMCSSVSHQEDSILHCEGSPSGSHCSSGPWRGLKWSIGVLGGPWRAKMRWIDADHNFCGLREKTKTGRSVWHGSQRSLEMTQWCPYSTCGHPEQPLWVPLNGILS